MSRTRGDVVRATVTLVAMVVSFLATDALSRGAGARHGPAILAAVLAMSLARRTIAVDARAIAVTPLTIAFAASGATGIGALLATRPILGAFAFVAGIAFSICAREFAGPWRRVGAAIALPLVAIVVVPARAAAPGGPAVDLALAVAAGVIALASVAVVRWLARRFSLVPESPPRPASSRGERPSVRRPTPTTRLAVQMVVALACAFAIGFSFFPSHWSWTVFTAFIVASGARGRGDVAYKGSQRLAGALAGTLFATLALRVWHPEGPFEAVAIFAVLFVGLVLRERHYAYWTAAMTLVLALLAGTNAGAPLDAAALESRLAAIAIGAIVAVGAAWFVLPIRTTDVVRKRLSAALVALDDLLARPSEAREARRNALVEFDARLAELESAGSPMALQYRVTHRGVPDHPARWVADARALRTFVDALPAALDADRVRFARRAIGEARRAIGRYRTTDATPGAPTVETTLRDVRDALDVR